MAITKKPLFILQLVALWLIVVALAAVTSLALVTSAIRSDCDPLSNSPISIANVTQCTSQERISAVVFHHASYFQSLHIILLQAMAACSLLIFKPSLWDMTWSALEDSAESNAGKVPTMKLATLQNGIEMTNSPGLLPAILYAKAANSITRHILFVIIASMLSLLSAVAVSPIYRSHRGPYSVSASLVVGGGVLVNISSSFQTGDFTAIGIVAGRALINAGTASNAPMPYVADNVSVAPFLPQHSVQAIWKTQIQTVVARNTVDCGSSAPTRLTNSQNVVTIDPEYYFASNRRVFKGISPLFAGQVLGSFTNDPQITAVYLNGSTTVAPGSVEAQTSVIFLAANGTLEGAQQKITSPEPTSRIMSVDVLVCTSTTRLEINSCTIDKGLVSSCESLPSSELPSNASTSDTGGVETYITFPGIVARVLSASAVTAFYNIHDRLPMYDQITPAMITSQIPPLSFLTVETNVSMYSLPLSYITDVLFGQTSQGLVQGILTTQQKTNVQQVFVTATFGTSKPELLYLTMALSIICALCATLSTALSRSARRVVPLDLGHLLAISRNPQLDAAFESYGDRSVEIDEDLLNTRVGYTWVESLNRRALVLAAAPGSSDGEGYKSIQIESESSINNWTDQNTGITSYGASPLQRYSGQGENVEMRTLI